MTATGLVLLVIGFLMLLMFGDAHRSSLSVGEFFGGTCVLSGFIFFTAGVTVWLWRVMP